jgi:hypothetical protein
MESMPGKNSRCPRHAREPWIGADSRNGVPPARRSEAADLQSLRLPAHRYPVLEYFLNSDDQLINPRARLKGISDLRMCIGSGPVTICVAKHAQSSSLTDTGGR